MKMHVIFRHFRNKFRYPLDNKTGIWALEKTGRDINRWHYHSVWDYEMAVRSAEKEIIDKYCWNNS